ncbi:MAG: methyltransferase domain-containing protein, partial [Anaeromyxobacteraceae bacterium]
MRGSPPHVPERLQRHRPALRARLGRAARRGRDPLRPGGDRARGRRPRPRLRDRPPRPTHPRAHDGPGAAGVGGGSGAEPPFRRCEAGGRSRSEPAPEALPPAAFDVVFCNSALHWFKETARALAACRRALRPGGRMAMQAPARQDYC